MQLKGILTAALSVGLLIVPSAPVHALPQGELAIGSTSVSLSTNSISFFSSGGAGGFDVGSSSTGAFSGLGGSTGTLQSISIPSQVGVPISVPNFLTLSSLPDAVFILTFVNGGIFSAAGCFASPPAAGQTCTLPGSPLNWVNTPTGAVASFSASGTTINAATGAHSTFTATFSTEFAGQSFQTLFGQLATGAVLRAPDSVSVNVPTGSFAGTLNIGQPSLAVSGPPLTGPFAIGFSPTNVTIGPTSTGTYVGLSGTDAIVQDLNTAVDPVGTPFFLPNFLIPIIRPDLGFNLTLLPGGFFGTSECSAPPALGQDCSLPGSPFNFINTPSGAFMSFSAEGIARDAAQQTAFEATFTTEFGGESYQNLFATLASGGTLNASYSVEFAAGPFGQSSAPEPATIALLGVGLAGLAASRRRKLN